MSQTNEACPHCENDTLRIQDADGDYIHGVDFHTSLKMLCTKQSRIGIRHWICTSCQPDYDYKGDAHEKSLAPPFVMAHNMNDDTFMLQVCDCPCHRPQIGEMVRQAWVSWANTHPQPKPSWLTPYEDLSPEDKEADMQIGERLFGAFLRWARSI